MTGAAIDRLLAVYTAVYSAHVQAGAEPGAARFNAQMACDDFTDYVSRRAGSLGR